MKQRIILAALLAATLFACTNTGTDNQRTTGSSSASNNLSAAGLQLRLEANPEWQYENLRLYPVIAEQSALRANASLPALKALAEGMQTAGFRITERKKFGRENDIWYNALTVQNKSQDTIFLMSGDVVTGGNQDRVIAYDDVIPPGTIKNIEVFCVEAGRSSYYDPGASESEKKVAAFRGYYSVASPQVRKAVYNGNQQGVWDAVKEVTTANAAGSSTQAYAALETENEQKAKREAYQRFFDGKITNLPDAVGVVAVCNGQVIGVDIFGRSDLFRQQYPALIHSYAAEAAIPGKTASDTHGSVREAFQQVARLSDPSQSGSAFAGKYSLGNTWVHLYKK